MAKKRPASNTEVLSMMRSLGFADEFSLGVVYVLDTDFLSDRMLRFLKNARPYTQEAVADQLIAILDDRSRYMKKHIDESRRKRKPVDQLFIDGFSINWDCTLDQSYVGEIPAISNIDKIDFHKNITFLVGENGTGKSTLLEAIAIAAGLNPEGGTQNYHFHTYDDHSDLQKAVRLYRTWGKPKWSYFLRAETFYNMATAANTDYNDPGSVPLPDYHVRSHGQSFLEFIQRFDSAGLYLMDEPEAALSPQRQLSLLLFLYRMAKAGSQFIIATHSPILLGTPDAEILSFDGGAVHPVTYEETECVRITRMFMQNRERFLQQLLAEE